MSVREINGIKLYSIEDVSYQFISHNKSKQVMYDFIEAMKILGIVEKEVIRYEKRTNYKYHMTDWFGELIKGHWCVLDNRTLFFDEYAAVILSRIYILYDNEKIKYNKAVNKIYRTIAYTAKDFVPKIPQEVYDIGK